MTPVAEAPEYHQTSTADIAFMFILQYGQDSCDNSNQRTDEP